MDSNLVTASAVYETKHFGDFMRLPLPRELTVLQRNDTGQTGTADEQASLQSEGNSSPVVVPMEHQQKCRRLGSILVESTRPPRPSTTFALCDSESTQCLQLPHDSMLGP